MSKVVKCAVENDIRKEFWKLRELPSMQAPEAATFAIVPKVADQRHQLRMEAACVPPLTMLSAL